MTYNDFQDIIERLVTEHNIQITLRNNDGIIYDLNTGMKSGLIIWYADGEAHYSGRYDTQGTFYGWSDLLYAVNGCMYGGNYGDSMWLELLEQEGLLTKKITTVVIYE